MPSQPDNPDPWEANLDSLQAGSNRVGQGRAGWRGDLEIGLFMGEITLTAERGQCQP